MFEYLRMFAPLADKVISGLVVIVSALVVSSVLRRLIDKLRDLNHVAPVMARRLHTLRRWLILILAILILMQALGVFGSAWGLISAGLAAVAIGFVAAWSMLSNATAALLILAFRPFRLGDTVELLESNGTGVGGRVVDMNLMYTTLSVDAVASAEAADATAPQFLCVPNNLFFQKILRTRSPHDRDSKAAFFPQHDA